VCLTPAFVEDALWQARFQIDATEVMLTGIIMLTKARKPGRAPAGADPSPGRQRVAVGIPELPFGR